MLGIWKDGKLGYTKKKVSLAHKYYYVLKSMEINKKINAD